MSSLPAPLRDFVTGLGIVALVLVVVRLFDPRGVGPETWVLLPIGAGLFTMRQGVRRIVLRQVQGGADGRDRASDADGTEVVGRDETLTPVASRPAAVAPRSWQEDPVRVIGLGVLIVVALVALAFL